MALGDNIQHLPPAHNCKSRQYELHHARTEAAVVLLNRKRIGNA